MIDTQSDALTLGIVGTGLMGRGIAQLAVQAGISVRLFDSRPDGALEACRAVAATLDGLRNKGRLTAGQQEAAARRLAVASSLTDLADCQVVIEAIVENLDAKRTLFAQLESVVSADCLLASNTSSLSVTHIASACARPGRVGGLHFFSPAPLMKVVEVIDAARSEPWVGDALATLVQRLGHRPIRAQDTPGFVVNHASRGYGTEALRILSEGIAEPATIDAIMRSAGFRMGPFELFDLTGLDVSLPVLESIYQQYYQEPRYKPSPLIRQRWAAGLLGRKSGRGFYAYPDGRLQPPAVPPAPPLTDIPIWISPAHPAWRDRLLARLSGSGAVLDPGERPGDDAVCVVLPLGHDATHGALASQLDPRRTVAVDPLSLDQHAVLMSTPITRPDLRDALWAALGHDGQPVSIIHDSPGFVRQRVLAMIVNIGCDIAQQRIASPGDIDAAVTLGLGYPQGPLALGDSLGPANVLAILDALHDFYRDPRYRPSPWLTRRARLGVSLLTPEA